MPMLEKFAIVNSLHRRSIAYFILTLKQAIEHGVCDTCKKPSATKAGGFLHVSSTSRYVKRHLRQIVVTTRCACSALIAHPNRRRPASTA